MKTAPLLCVELARSRLAVLLVCVACLSTAALLAWLPMVFLWIRIAGVVAIGAYAVWLLRMWAMRILSRSIVGIELGIDHQIALIELSGSRVDGVVRPDSYVGPFVTTVVMRPHAARRSRAMAILPDMLPREDFRQLRVLLRLGQKPRDET